MGPCRPKLLSLPLPQQPSPPPYLEADCCIVVVGASRIDAVVIITFPPSRTYQPEQQRAEKRKMPWRRSRWLSCCHAFVLPLLPPLQPKMITSRRVTIASTAICLPLPLPHVLATHPPLPSPRLPIASRANRPPLPLPGAPATCPPLLSPAQ